ncbi:UNVERIFIED_CONTAM: hypothetical protein Sindi_1680100 [Sesamum indicum]
MDPNKDRECKGKDVEKIPDNDNVPKREVINTISRGPTDVHSANSSNRYAQNLRCRWKTLVVIQRKEDSIVSFDENEFRDVEGPQIDPVAILMDIASLEV